MHKRKQIDPMPEEFASYEEAAEFWDTHDTTDYPEAFHTIEVVSELRRRHYEIEIDADGEAHLPTGWMELLSFAPVCGGSVSRQHLFLSRNVAVAIR